MSVRNKYGHQDLFGWKNIHNIRSELSYDFASAFEVTFLFTSTWLATPLDALYSGSGSVLARSETGEDGRHVGEGTALFCTYEYGSFEFGAGYAYLFKGGFLDRTSPGGSPTYVYAYHTYSF